jgi:uncharacterized protein (TIGR02246 family)
MNVSFSKKGGIMKRIPLAGLCVLTALLSTLSAPLFAADSGAQALDNAFVKAVKAGDIDAVVALYAPDAMLYPPGEMAAKGRDAIRAVWGGFLSANTVTECKLFETGYRTSGDTSIGWGRFSMTTQPKAGSAPFTLDGRYTDVAVKKDGNWLYVVDHVSAPLPPPPKEIPKIK